MKRSRRSRRFRKRYIRTRILDRVISIRDILRYALYAIGIIALIFVIVAVPFYIGRTTADCGCTDIQITGNAQEVLQSTNSGYENENTNAIIREVDEINETGNIVINETEADPGSTVEINDTIDLTNNESNQTEQENNETEEETEQELVFDGKIELTLEDFDFEKRGENWGTINEIKFSIRNGKNRTVTFTNINIRVHSTEGAIPSHWDEELEFYGDASKIEPGQTITKITPVHISFNDLGEEKIMNFYIYDKGFKILRKDEKIII